MPEPEEQKDTLNLRVITPQVEVFNSPVKKLLLEGLNGVMEVMPGHEPLLAPLKVGMMALVREDSQSEQDELFSIHGGFLEISEGNAIILADAAEFGKDIDVERARSAQQRAKERLTVRTDTKVDQDRAQMALLRSITRINAAEGNLFGK